jgi:hypothetical protein
MRNSRAAIDSTNATAIGRDYGVSRTLIRGIKQGRNRASVSEGTAA